MKALELTVHPPIPPDPYEFGMLMHNEPEVTAWENARYEEDVAKYRKRLTDSELAADYHAWIAHMNKMQWTEEVLMKQDEPEWPENVWDRLGERASIIYRFATLPHYDEDQP